MKTRPFDFLCFSDARHRHAQAESCRLLPVPRMRLGSAGLEGFAKAAARYLLRKKSPVKIVPLAESIDK